MSERKNFKHLSFTKRIQIETLLNKKIPIKEIAETIGTHISTIYREIKRGRYKRKVSYNDYCERQYKYVDSYSPDIAEDRYRFNLHAKGAPLKIGKDLKYAEYIENRIVYGKLTPLAVLGEIKQLGLNFNTSVSVHTLYNYIYKGVFFNLSMKDLMFKGKRRPRKKSLSIKKAPRGTSIECRPNNVIKRSEFGHWEMDCVCGPRGTSPVLLVLSERLSRMEIIMKMKNQTSNEVIRCLNILERRYGKLFKKVFKTITVDNGSEFSSFKEMEKSIFGLKQKRTAVFYCHPYSSYERGTNERLNREIRRIFPKGTNFCKIDDSEIKNVEKWLNEYPRGILGYKTPVEVFNKHFSTL